MPTDDQERHAVPAKHIECSSGYGHNTQEPYVQMLIYEEDWMTQMSPSEARNLALNLLLCADAAESDGFLVTFLQRTIGVDDMRAIASLLVQFREYRESQASKIRQEINMYKAVDKKFSYSLRWKPIGAAGNMPEQEPGAEMVRCIPGALDEFGEAAYVPEWRTLVSEMSAMSKLFPDALFGVYVHEWVNNEWWIVYFLDGKTQEGDSDIVYEEPSEGAWHEPRDNDSEND